MLNTVMWFLAGLTNSFYYSDDAIMIDPTMAYTYSAMYYNGVPLQVDQEQLREFVRNQMYVLSAKCVGTLLRDNRAC